MRIKICRKEAKESRYWLRLIEAFGDEFFTDPGIFFPREVVGSQVHKRAAQKIASQAVVVTKPAGRVPPISFERLRDDGLLFIFVRPHVTYSDPTAGSLAEPVLAAFENVEFREVNPDTKPSELADLIDSAPKYGAIVIAASIKPAAWHRFGLLPEQQRFVHEMLKRGPVILAALGSPRLLDDFPEASIGICTFSDVAVSQQALLDTLLDLFQNHSDR